MANYKEFLKNIKAFVFDYDGVLSDGYVTTTNDGEVFRTTSVKDGYALQLARKKGYRIAVISGARSEAMIHRMKALHITDVFMGVDNKLEVFNKYLKDNGLNSEQVLYMGDDIPDYEVMKEAGIATCPADAAEEIKAVSIYISHHNGGKGCVRDVIEQVMKVQDQWMRDDGYHW
ncbi:MAG: HAD-IIIA family hydrolase [Bacteroidales bacterium]|nr:HAD-IIIA family hydrolase [Bacteroidales bacterium]HNW74725.1 HAD-IIIA family hydrolase [Bacteroidales bacterium]HPS50389.1 HAD-IIIA family hydrolase [Bacteroidales bacterium]